MELVKIKINNRVDKIFNIAPSNGGAAAQANNHYIIRNCDLGAKQELFSMREADGNYPWKIVKVDVEEASSRLVVTLKKLEITDLGNNNDTENVEHITRRNGKIVCKMLKPEKNDFWEVKFMLEGSDKGISFFLHYATTVYDAIIDFGSEASQACWATGNHQYPVNITESIYLLSPQKVKKAKSKTGKQPETKTGKQPETKTGKQPETKTGKQPEIKTEEDSEDEAKAFVQFESSELYKSIYYIKKDLKIKPNPWPDYGSDAIKFLVAKDAEVDTLTKQYLQLPNTKLIQFNIANYARMRVKLNRTPISLMQLGDNVVERVLMNNIVLQTLHSIQVNAASAENDAYVTLNVLMPNVYPVQLVSKKLNQLAKDIDDFLKDEKSKESYKNIKAVELRPVSESDASLLGYAQTNKLDSGNYLIMDAGKGTLDFSIVGVNELGRRAYVNKSRAGIVGAGNAITYGLIVGLVNDFLSEMLNKYSTTMIEEREPLIQKFIFEKILGGEGQRVDVAKIQRFNNAVESYKKVYNNLYCSGSAPQESINESQQSKPLSELQFDEFNQWIEALRDKNKNLTEESRAYVTIEIKSIVSEALGSLQWMFDRFRQGNNDILPVESVVFTGRGFLMKELQDEMRSRLIEAGIVDDHKDPIVPDKKSMKSGCMNINQILSGDIYDVSPSEQIIGLFNNVGDGNNEQREKRNSQIKATPFIFELFDPMREAGGDRPPVNDGGDLGTNGFIIPWERRAAHSTISIGGWCYTIPNDFVGKDIKIFFDDTDCWIEAEGVDRRRLDGGVPIQSPSLCFESLFPNVRVESLDQVVIPKEKETETEAETETETETETEQSPVMPNDAIAEEPQKNSDPKAPQPSKKGGKPGLFRKIWAGLKKIAANDENNHNDIEPNNQEQTS